MLTLLKREFSTYLFGIGFRTSLRFCDAVGKNRDGTLNRSVIWVLVLLRENLLRCRDKGQSINDVMQTRRIFDPPPPRHAFLY